MLKKLSNGIEELLGAISNGIGTKFKLGDHTTPLWPFVLFCLSFVIIVLALGIFLGLKEKGII